MATDLEKLVVSLEANLKQYERELARAQKLTVTQMRKIEGDVAKGAGRIEKTLGRAGSALAGFGKGLVIGGIATAVAGLGAIVTSSVSTAAAIGDLSEKLGITSDKLQELQYGAVQANLSFEGLEGGLLKFNKALAQAQNGSGDLLKTLEANGFTKAQIKALSYSEALDVVADLIKNARNEQDAFLITTQAFGKGNDEFVEFLRGGSKGLKDFGEDARKASAVIDNELIASAQKFDDAWARATQGAKSSIANWTLYSITQLAKFGTKAIEVSEDVQKALGLSNNVESFGGTKMGGSSQAGGFASPKGDRQPTTKLYDPEAAAAAAQAAKELAREKEKQAEAIQRVIDALNLEASSIGKSNVQQQVATALARADVTATSEQGRAITALIEKTEMHRAVLETVAFAADQAAERQQEFIASQMYLAEAGVSAFQKWAVEGGKLSDVITDLAKSLADAALQATLFGSGPLAGLFGSVGGGLFSNLFSPVGLYAKGGQIPSGQMGIAGEAGPELIQGPANVIPFNKLTSGGRQTVNINVNLSGANGNAEVERIAQRGVQKGLREYQRQQPQAELERGLRQT